MNGSFMDRDDVWTVQRAMEIADYIELALSMAGVHVAERSHSPNSAFYGVVQCTDEIEAIKGGLTREQYRNRVHLTTRSRATLFDELITKTPMELRERLCGTDTHFTFMKFDGGWETKYNGVQRLYDTLDRSETWKLRFATWTPIPEDDVGNDVRRLLTEGAHLGITPWGKR